MYEAFIQKKGLPYADGAFDGFNACYKKMQSKLDKCLEALEFYVKMDTDDAEFYIDWNGGERARKTISEVRGDGCASVL